jgi:hypothetical protein
VWYTGGVITRVDENGIECPVKFLSQNPINKELLAINVYALQKIKKYLLGKHFTLCVYANSSAVK